MNVLLFVVASTLSASGAAASEDLELLIPNMIEAAEIKYELPTGILHALIKTESSFDHTALVPSDGVSRKPSYGLTQMQLDSARFIQNIKAKKEGVKIVFFSKKKHHLKEGEVWAITPKQLMNPETNIDYGAAYLRWMLDQHKNDVSRALTCYNAGPVSPLCKGKKYSSYVGLILNAWISSQKQAN